MKSLKRFISKGFSLFSLSKKHKRRRNKTRRNKRRHSRRHFMRGGWGEPMLPSTKDIFDSRTYKGGIMKGGWGGAVPTDIQIQ